MTTTPNTILNMRKAFRKKGPEKKDLTGWTRLKLTRNIIKTESK